MAMRLPIPQLTIADLERFPSDGNRYELLDGYLLVTPAPGVPHDLVVFNLMWALVEYVGPYDNAVVFPRGAVQLEPRTHLEPDMLVIPASSSEPFAQTWAAMPPAWLVVEILSRSSRKNDMVLKRPAYLKLGAREVWIVDPKNHKIHVSTNDATRTHVIGDVLRWHPAEMPVALELEVAKVFRRVP